MKTVGRIIILIVLVSSYSCTPYRPASTYQGNNTMQVFYDELSPYGDWVHNREFGYAWIPRVGRNFFPYATDGQWLMTEYGWTWFSDFDWGWAPFHYGRWDFDPNYGWFWFPGNEWAPAWVTWRYGDGYYGWSPLAPNDAMGRSGSMFANDSYRWIFIRERDFGRSNLDRYVINQQRNNEILRSTREIDYSRRGDNRLAYHPGPDPDDVQKATGRKIRRLEVRESNMPGRRVSNNTLEIYRPRIEDRAGENRPAPSVISDVKNIRPMRERDGRYTPGTEPARQPELGGQGSRNIDRDEEELRKQREVERQYREKQVERQRRQEETELEQQSRSVDNAGQRSEPARTQRQNSQVRQQKTDQQRKTMEKDREKTVRQNEADTSKTRRVEREATNTSRRRR